MNEPHVVIGRNAQADRLPEHVVVRHRLRPERIHFEPRHLLGLCRGPCRASPGRRRAPTSRATSVDAYEFLRFFFTRAISPPAGSWQSHTRDSLHVHRRASAGRCSASDTGLGNLRLRDQHIMEPLAVVVLLAAPARRLTGPRGPQRGHGLAFVKPEGQTLRLLVRAPIKLAARHRRSDLRRRLPRFLEARRRRCGTPPGVDLATSCSSARTDRRCQAARCARDPHLAARRTGRSRATTQALANITRAHALPDDTDIFWEQGMLDVLFEYPIGSDRSQFAIRPGPDAARPAGERRPALPPPGNAERVFDVHADTGIVQLDPRWHQAAWLFVTDGFLHILDGTDHLLFLLCLVIPFRRLRPLRADRDRLHRRALGHADRVRLRPGARTRCGSRR